MKNCLLMIISTLLFSSYAFGATFTVNSNADTSDVNTSDGLCLNASGNCSLRAAVEQANALTSSDVINFAANINSILLASQISISNSGSLIINGRGANLLTVANTNSNSRVFQSDAATLTITDLTVSGGRIGAFNVASGAGMLVNGGAVTLQRVVFNDNLNLNGRTMAADGGGINFIGGNHVVQNSTFSNNRASGKGGGISNNGGMLTISNSTFSGNIASFSNGGGISNSGNLDLFNVTISSNIASTSCISLCAGAGGGISHTAGALRIANTIVSGNSSEARGTSPVRPEIEFTGGTFTSSGNNFIGDSAGDSTDTGNSVAYQPTDIRDIPPQLASLGNYGGMTPTRALLANSPAINAGNDANAPPTDQRGVARVNASDIGAYEYNGSSFTISGRVTTDGTNGFGGVTVTLSGSGSATVTTNSNGDYIFTGLIEGGNYTVTPSFPNTVFNPPSASFNNLSGSQTANFRPQCVYSISPSSASISANGGTSSFNLTTSAGCSWTAASSSDFISLTNGSGSGSGLIGYTVAPNPGAVRTGTITVAGFTFTITQAALPVFSINNISLLEGNSGTTAFVFTVTLAGSFTQTATVNYATVNGTATPPTDYQATSGSLSFAPGETSKTITILVNGDTTVEPNETFSVNLSGASNATIANAQGIGTIRNDDGAAAKTAFDFDGDGKSDVSVFRPSTGYWFTSQNPAINYGAYQFGQSGDKIVPADYDGDGKTDIAVNRNGNWYIQRSTQGFTGIQFGDGNDIPVPADYDGDGKADIAVFRPSNGTWYLLQSQSGFAAIALGLGTDKPVPGDYNGDGKAEVAVFRPSNGYWYLSTDPAIGYGGVQFGQSEDKLVPADYDGDGKTDIAVFRPSNGYWYLLRSSLGFTGIQFGFGTDTPVPADYDGDGKTDIAVNRSGNWYLLQSSAGFTGIQFGVGEDKSVPNSLVR